MTIKRVSKYMAVVLLTIAPLVGLSACADDDLDDLDLVNSVQSVTAPTDVNYRELWSNYDADTYEGQNVRIAGKVYSSDGFLLIREGLSGLTANLHFTFEDESDLDDIQPGDYVIIEATLREKLVKQINFEKSQIVGVGKEAKDLDDKYVEELEESEKLAKKEQTIERRSDMELYKEKSKTVSYDELVSNPNKYKGKALSVNVDIRRMRDAGILIPSLYVASSDGDGWYISYDYPEGVPKLLKGENVTFYGEFDGLVMVRKHLGGAGVMLPRLKALYHE